MSSDLNTVTIQPKTDNTQNEKYANLNSSSKETSTTKIEINSNIVEGKLISKNKANDLKIEPIVISSKIKFLLVMLVFCIYLIYRIFFESFDHFEKIQNSHFTAKKCFYDEWALTVTGPINKYLTENLILKDLLVVFSADLMDILLLSFLLYYVIYSNCARTILTIFTFYFLRSNLQKNFLFSIYENYLFYAIDGFSFTVPAGRTADFFYSGHCGSAMIVTLSFRDKGVDIFYYFGIFVVIAQIFILTITRSHYSIDVVFGIIIAHYLYIIVGSFLKNLFPKVKAIFEKILDFLKKLIVCEFFMSRN
jgi:hypothetical protein